jgi:hypothetical protein
MGGCVATEGQWLAVESQWAELLHDFEINNFHTKDLIGKHWWPEFSRRARILINQGTLFSIEAAVIDKDYKEFKQKIQALVRRYRPDSAYAMCFRQCMIHTCDLVGHRYPGEQISFFLEDGHRNINDAHRVYTVTKHGNIGPGKWSRYAPFLRSFAAAPGSLYTMELADFCSNAGYQDLVAGRFIPTKKQPKLPHRIRVLCTKKYFDEKLIPVILEEKEKQRQYADRRLKNHAKEKN